MTESSSAASKLAAYLEKTKQTPSSFARALGAHRAQVYRLLSGERGPSAYLAALIEQRTGGAVRAAEWPPRHRSTKRKTARRGLRSRAAAREVSVRQ